MSVLLEPNIENQIFVTSITTWKTLHTLYTPPQTPPWVQADPWATPWPMNLQGLMGWGGVWGGAVVLPQSQGFLSPARFDPTDFIRLERSHIDPFRDPHCDSPPSTYTTKHTMMLDDCYFSINGWWFMSHDWLCMFHKCGSWFMTDGCGTRVDDWWLVIDWLLMHTHWW